MRILVAEDDRALAHLVKKGLEFEHYAVDVSADGEQARAMAGELDFDLVMLDLNLPRMDGVAIPRFLRTRKPSMPMLVLTGRTRVKAAQPTSNPARNQPSTGSLPCSRSATPAFASRAIRTMFQFIILALIPIGSCPRPGLQSWFVC